MESQITLGSLPRISQDFLIPRVPRRATPRLAFNIGPTNGCNRYVDYVQDLAAACVEFEHEFSPLDLENRPNKRGV